MSQNRDREEGHPDAVYLSYDSRDQEKSLDSSPNPSASKLASSILSQHESEIYDVFDPNLDSDSLLEDDSPYPEVRSAVANFDDPDMPASTLRAWILGILWAVVIPGMNQFFYFRYPSVAIGGLVAQLLVFPLGRAWARLLPNTTIFGCEINPGPFSIKEHVLVTIMAGVGAQSAYATDIVAVQRVYYNQIFPFTYQWLLVMSTQLIGFSMGGVARRFLVTPPSMIWPNTLVSCALFNTLHSQSYAGIGQHEVWYFFPGYLFQALSVFTWVCWVAPNNVKINQMFGYRSGLGFSLLTFDWAQIAFIGSPLATPWWAEANVMIGFFFFYWFLTPILYYKNIWFSQYMPVSSINAFDNEGKIYDLKRIIDDNASIRVQAYREYSPVYLSVTFVISYGLSFLSITATISHAIIHFWKPIKVQFKQSLREPPDIHARLMERYPQGCAVPPRPMFWCQVVATIIAGTVQLGVQSWMFTNIPDLCDKEQKDNFTCASTHVFGTASIIWGVIGPALQFSKGQIYYFDIFLSYRRRLPRYPLAHHSTISKQYLKLSKVITSFPLIFSGVGQIPPATAVNYVPWAIIGFLFQFVVRRRNFAYWAKYNYVLSAALDAGTAVGVIIVFFCLQYPLNGTIGKHTIRGWWGNQVFRNTLDWRNVTFKTLPDGETFGVFLQAGEFHTWRLPVPGLWKDITQKAKAAGLNALSIYVHWHLLNPKAGVIDMTGINDLQPLFDAAKEAGIWIIARPGPYINAETTAGGLPGHVATIPGDPYWNPYNGEIRSNDTNFHNAWQDYWNAVIPVIARNQITLGGPVIMLQIENEYYNGPGQNEYVEELRERALDLGIVVPTMVNDPGMYRNLVDSADIYGIDAYPVTFDCSNPSVWRDIPTTWRTYHESVTPEIPFMFPEFQGGSYDRWGSAGGYAACRELTNPNFQRVHNFHLWANGVTAVSYYMFYVSHRSGVQVHPNHAQGGTSWGQLPYTNAYTSYDYGAAVTESRELSAKYGELKLQSLFLRSFADFRMTKWKGEDNTTTLGVSTTHLQSPETGSSFYILRHTKSSDPAVVSLKPTVGSRNITVPQLGGSATLLGRDSIIISADLKFGSSKLHYSTAMLLSAFKLDGDDALVVYGTSGLTYEVALLLKVAPTIATFGPSKIHTKFVKNDQAFIINFTLAPGLTTVRISTPRKTIVILIADYDTATNFWMPTIAGKGEFAEFIDVGASAPLLISGPYLIRTAALAGETLALEGDLSGATTLTVYGPKALNFITWNGKRVGGLKRTNAGSWQAQLHASNAHVKLPDLMTARWKYADSLPEIKSTFDDAALVEASHTNTTNTFLPYYGGPWILYADDYGFHGGNLLWQGTFEHDTSLPAPTAVNISVSGGIHFAASVWLNEYYLGPSDTRLATNNESWPVSPDMLRFGENHVTVLQDHMGGNLAGQIVCCTPGGRQRDLQQPRGIQGYYLEGRPPTAQFTKWRLAGNLGGEDFPDKTRKILNEGGLYAERMGWHLPKFDDAAWETRTPFEGLDKPGVGFFRTTFDLDLPSGYDIPLSVVFDAEPGHYRAQLYINGWQLGKRVANIGPQTSFVVHEGILDYGGPNVLAISLWSLGDEEGDLRIPGVRLVRGTVYEGGIQGIGVNNPDWKELRG
ncbi:hypothetical protein D9615_005535 [Tricholomella constricta]|uniref:Beta-galactosidase n=1 Tax=Tricholomella constricta TaxID=117010 RepID=A0A8H5M5M4_9AGAR|nr:hypothetical protein D9615_005535 [Tricholomella constricta]